MKKTVLLAVTLFAASAVCGFSAEAKENWEQHCAKCHGADGKGGSKMGQKLGVRDYTDPAVKATIKDEEAFKALKEGLTKNGKQVMKPFSPELTDEELKALVAYVRAL
jgi:mono/diheme cytochrome c family protein